VPSQAVAPHDSSLAQAIVQQLPLSPVTPQIPEAHAALEAQGAPAARLVPVLDDVVDSPCPPVVAPVEIV